MEQLASDTCTNGKVTYILNSTGWQRECVGVCQLVCQATAVTQFHVQIIQSKACNESKYGYFAIRKLAKLSQKVKCSGRHVVCNYWWYIHSLL